MNSPPPSPPSSTPTNQLNSARTVKLSDIPPINDENNKYMYIIEPDGEHIYTIIFLHGLGGSAQGYIQLFSDLNKISGLKNTKVILPQAPVRAITHNRGLLMAAWNDIYHDRWIGEQQDEEGILQSLDTVTALIDQEISTTQLDPSNIIIGGMSQGSALAQLVAVRYPKQLAGVLALSGYALLCDSKNNHFTPEGVKTPHLVYHGKNDPMVPCSIARKSRDYYLNRGIVNLKYLEEPGLGHTISTGTLAAVKEFLSEINWDMA